MAAPCASRPLMLLLLAHLFSLISTMAVKGCRVCTSSTCSNNGSNMLLDAMQLLSTDDVAIEEDYCLGGCCQGVVVKPTGITQKPRRKVIKGLLVVEAAAIELAQDLLTDLDGIDEESLRSLKAKLSDGERVLRNSEPPDVCQSCGVSLQLYRGNCAKCGKYPY